VPDLVSIRDRRGALAGIQLYVGDGATLVRPMVRRRGRALIGHSAVTTQMEWCAAEGVRRAIFTHCGAGLLAQDGRQLAARLCVMGRDRGVDARVAYDGLRVRL
jgi:hypothetical protein